MFRQFYRESAKYCLEAKNNKIIVYPAFCIKMGCKRNKHGYVILMNLTPESFVVHQRTLSLTARTFSIEEKWWLIGKASCTGAGSSVKHDVDEDDSFISSSVETM